jgi:integrase
MYDAHDCHSEGKGAIRQRGNRWQVDTMVGGRRVRRSAKTLEDARSLLADLNLGNGAVAVTSDSSRPQPRGQMLTVGEMLNRYLESTRIHCRPRTIRTSEAAVRRLGEFFGDRPAAALSRTDIDRYTANRLAQGVGPHTPNRDLACLRAALTQAKDDGFIDRAPKVRMLRTVHGLPRILTASQIKRLVRNGGNLSALLATASATGLRAAELRWLSWADVDTQNCAIEVRAKLDWRPKTHCERSIPIPPSLADILSRHREAVCSKRSDWAFPVPTHGGRWTETGLSHAAKRIAQRAGVWEEGCKALHDLRRSWASHLLAAGTPMDTVRRLGGWASNSTLEKFYLAPTQSAIDKAIAASGALL